MPKTFNAVWHIQTWRFALYIYCSVTQLFPDTAHYRDEADSGYSGDSVFQHQVKTDTLRLGRSNKQTDKPINTFKAQYALFHEISWEKKSYECILKLFSLSAHLKMCFWHLKIIWQSLLIRILHTHLRCYKKERVILKMEMHGDLKANRTKDFHFLFIYIFFQSFFNFNKNGSGTNVTFSSCRDSLHVDCLFRNNKSFCYDDSVCHF